MYLSVGGSEREQLSGFDLVHNSLEIVLLQHWASIKRRWTNCVSVCTNTCKGFIIILGSMYRMWRQAVSFEGTFPGFNVGD